MKNNGSYGLPISMCLGVVLDHNGEEDNEDDTDDKQRAYKFRFVVTRVPKVVSSM